jgi:hypothetical protein
MAKRLGGQLPDLSASAAFQQSWQTHHQEPENVPESTS